MCLVEEWAAPALLLIGKLCLQSRMKKGRACLAAAERSEAHGDGHDSFICTDGKEKSFCRSFLMRDLKLLHHAASEQFILLSAVQQAKLSRFKFAPNWTKSRCTGSPLSVKSWQMCRSLILCKRHPDPEIQACLNIDCKPMHPFLSMPNKKKITFLNFCHSVLWNWLIWRFIHPCLQDDQAASSDLFLCTEGEFFELMLFAALQWSFPAIFPCWSLLLRGSFPQHRASWPWGLGWFSC